MNRGGVVAARLDPQQVYTFNPEFARDWGFLHSPETVVLGLMNKILYGCLQ